MILEQWCALHMTFTEGAMYLCSLQRHSQNPRGFKGRAARCNKQVTSTSRVPHRLLPSALWRPECIIIFEQSPSLRFRLYMTSTESRTLWRSNLQRHSHIHRVIQKIEQRHVDAADKKRQDTHPDRITNLEEWPSACTWHQRSHVATLTHAQAGSKHAKKACRCNRRALIRYTPWPCQQNLWAMAFLPRTWSDSHIWSCKQLTRYSELWRTAQTAHQLMSSTHIYILLCAAAAPYFQDWNYTEVVMDAIVNTGLTSTTKLACNKLMDINNCGHVSVAMQCIPLQQPRSVKAAVRFGILLS